MEERREPILDPTRIKLTQQTSAAIRQISEGYTSLMKVMDEQVEDAYRQMEYAQTYMKQQLECSSVENVIEEGKTKEVIAVLNAIYESGMIAHERTSKKEFFQRMADALGQPGLANYEVALSQIKQAYKYENIFDKLHEVAKEVRDKE